MKSILLIGLGRFGRSIAEKLNEMNHQVMAVDRDEARVNDVLPLVTEAQIGDATNEAFLRSLGVDNYDVCFVAIGEDFQSSLETTSLLKELGAKKVVSRASRGVHRIIAVMAAKAHSRSSIRPQEKNASSAPHMLAFCRLYRNRSWLRILSGSVPAAAAISFIRPPVLSASPYRGIRSTWGSYLYPSLTSRLK